MKRGIISIVLMSTLLSGTAQTNVQHYNAESGIATGITYNLPQTEIVVEANARYTISKPGPFYQYAERYLGTKDVVTTESRTWQLENIEIKRHTKSDPKRCYQIMPCKKGVSNNISYFRDNIIAGINSPLAKKSHNKRNEVSEIDTLITFDMSKLNAETLIASSIPKMAETAAQQIYNIRESRTALLSADVDHMPDGKALKAMLNNLDKIEKELIALFVGKTKSYTTIKQYTLLPEDDMSNHIIFRISSINGLVDPDDMLGTPIYLNLKGKYLAEPTNSKKKSPKKLGFYYIVPGEATITILNNNKIVATRTLIMPQFGYTANLPLDITDQLGSKIIYNPHHGTIKAISK